MILMVLGVVVVVVAIDCITHWLAYNFFCVFAICFRFSPSATKTLCENILKEKLVDVVWDEDECKDLSLTISDEIRAAVTKQDYSRYKIIVQCTIGENKQQGVLITSRCLWEPNTDNYAAASFKNDQVWANVMVFCCYTY